MNAIRWNITVSSETDQDLRLFLADHGRGENSDLSRFVEEAVRARLMELTAEQAKAANGKINEAHLTAMVAESIQWARRD